MYIFTFTKKPERIPYVNLNNQIHIKITKRRFVIGTSEAHRAYNLPKYSLYSILYSILDIDHLENFILIQTKYHHGNIQ